MGAMNLLRSLAADLRYAARMLARSPGFTLVSVISLSIGIGMSTSVYSQFESMIFRRIPMVADPDSLVRLQSPVSYPNFEAFRDQSGQFQSLAAYMAPVPFVLTGGGKPERVWGHLVSPNYFEVLGVKPHTGAFFAPRQTRGAVPEAVISHRFWQRKLGGARDVMGGTLRINGELVTVIGIAPEDFLGASPMMAAADLWIPTTAQTRVAPELARGALEQRRVAAFWVAGRLRPGLGEHQAEEALEALARRLEQIHNDPNKDSKERRVRLLPGGKLMPIRDQDLPLVLGWPIILIGLILWIASANVATMLLARSAARRRELAVRLSLGAARSRIVRQLLTECALLALLGGAAGLGLAYWSNSTLDYFKPLMPNYVDLRLEISGSAFLFTFLLSVVTGMLFGLAPALQVTRTGLASSLKAGAAPMLRRYRWFSTRNLLVLQQVAGSLTLLMLTGFIVLGFQRTSTIDLGFDSRGLYLVSLDPVRDGYDTPRTLRFFDRLPERARQLPGVTAASLSQSVPLSMFRGETMMARNMELTEGQAVVRSLHRERVGAGFFETVGIPILRGRGFRPPDQRDDPRVIVVNETIAREDWPGGDPVGKTLMIEEKTYEIVGVAKDVRSGFMMAAAERVAYIPMEPSGFANPTAEGVTLLVRGAPGVDVPDQVRRLIQASDPDLSVFSVRSMTEQVNQILYLVQVTTVTYSAIGLFGLVLAAAGLAGVTAYAVAQRTKEIGIRLALGATNGSILKLVMREGLIILGIGSALGMGAAFGIRRLLSAYMELIGQLTGTSASDPLLLVGAPALLAALAMLSCWWPAWRSTKVDPLVALREE